MSAVSRSILLPLASPSAASRSSSSPAIQPKRSRIASLASHLYKNPLTERRCAASFPSTHLNERPRRSDAVACLAVQKDLLLLDARAFACEFSDLYRP